MNQVAHTKHQVILVYANLVFDYSGGVSGDIVKVQLTDIDYLHLAEIHIFDTLE